jgi:flagellar hook-length control protein FliK
MIDAALEAMLPDGFAAEAVGEQHAPVTPALADSSAHGDNTPGSGHALAGLAASETVDARDGVGRWNQRLGLAGGPERGLNDAERMRLWDRVARAVNSAGNQGGLVRVRLSPPHLGAVRMEVVLREGVLTARLEAETPQARALLLEGVPALRERLASQEIVLERFEVDLMDQSAGGPPRQPADEGPAPRPAPYSSAAGESNPSGELTPAGAGLAPGAGEHLNVVI